MKRSKRILTMLMVLAMVLTLLPMAALADEEPDLDFQEVSGNVKASALRDGAIVVLSGDTVLTLDAAKTVLGITNGKVSADGKSLEETEATALTIQGSAALTLTEGAYIRGSVTVESGTVNASGDGISVKGDMTVNGGSITATGADCGITCEQLLMSGGSITATGTNKGGDDGVSDGIYTIVLKMTGGSIKATGSEDGICIDYLYEISEGVDVLSPAKGSFSEDPVEIPAWSTGSFKYETFTVLNADGSVAKSVEIGVPSKGFTDVKAGEYYAVPVDWAAANGITTGTSDTTFAPGQTCTRAQVVTFLWRAAGSPEPKSTTNPFTDVKAKDYFYKAVLWAAENNITTGTSQTTFSPNQTCTRGQVVTFLYRAEGAPKVSGGASFTDVKTSDYFYNAVVWAVANGVTNGVSATQFGPAKGCTRGQVVTFLYRDLHEIPTAEDLDADSDQARR